MHIGILVLSSSLSDFKVETREYKGDKGHIIICSGISDYILKNVIILFPNFFFFLFEVHHTKILQV